MSQTFLDEYLDRKLRSKDPQERASARAVKEFLDKIKKKKQSEESEFETPEQILGGEK